MCEQLKLQSDIDETETITKPREHIFHNCDHKPEFPLIYL